MKRILVYALAMVASIVVTGVTPSVGMAVNLNGTYAGKWSCTQVNNDGTSTKLAEPASIVAMSHDTNTNILLLTIDGVLYTGRVIPDAKLPLKNGTAIFIAVGTSDDPVNFNELEKVKVTNGGSNLTKKTIYVDALGIGECTGSWKRSD